MFRCERCGTGFNATVATIAETCPRCRHRGIDARLSFRLFEPAAGPDFDDRREEPATEGRSRTGAGTDPGAPGEG